jgi:Gluconate 2-dehydrogenase subunit 3
MTSLREEQAEFLLVVARRIVPEVASLDQGGLAMMLGLIDHTLAERGGKVRRKLGVFLGALRWAPALRYGRSFDALPPQAQDAVLRWFESAPLSPLRQGMWGLKAMVFLGYYGRPEAWQEIGYDPASDSLERLGA